MNQVLSAQSPLTWACRCQHGALLDYAHTAMLTLFCRFDIYSFGFSGAEDKEGMMKSSGSINELIEQEITNGIDPSHIVLGGFSQGGAMTLLTGLTSRYKLAGLTVLSGWLPLRTQVKEVSLSSAINMISSYAFLFFFFFCADHFPTRRFFAYILGTRKC